jgi:hypothetical protein
MMLSVIVPTVDGREEMLESCLSSYERTLASESWEVLVYRNKPTCGVAWNEGVKEAKGSFIHLTADDIEAHDGWFEAGLESLQRGELPAALILHSDGSLQSCGDEHDRPNGFVTEIPRIPFLTAHLARLIFPISPLHYYSDNLVGDAARRLGWETVVNREYCFTHHLASAGRIDERLMSDYRRYMNGREQ